jgi:HAD superfamily hydrolase (TIGR01490 family)
MMKTKAAVLALFDLDGTLLPTDSDHAFGEFVIELGWADARAHRERNDGFFADYVAGTLDMAAYVDFATSPWRNRPAAELDNALTRFVDQIVMPQLHPAAVALVERHREAGDDLAIVTATNEVVTRPIADAFGIPALLATGLERGPGGQVTGRIAGTPCFREGKIEHVQAWLARRGRALKDYERVVFYSDSSNDLPLLEAVSHPVATNPGAGLERIAVERGWPILRLFE